MSYLHFSYVYVTYVSSWLFDADASCVQETDCLGRTAVVYAVQFSCLDSLQNLLERSANVNATALGQLPV